MMWIRSLNKFGGLKVMRMLVKTLFFVTLILVFNLFNVALADEGEIVKEEPSGQSINSTEQRYNVLKLLSNSLSELEISGGVSGGWFYTTEPIINTKSSNFILTNLLLDISSSIGGGIAGFNLGLGGVATPSVFSTLNEALPVFDIEYAQINLKPVKPILFEIGLLRPNSGYESTYTFNNPNITVGALASQQPYNAVGARFTYIQSEDLKVWIGMYKHRLSDEEYMTEIEENAEPRSVGAQDSNSWEAGINSSVNRIGISLYHYHLNALRYLSGIILDYSEIKNLYLAVNADYWHWSSNMEKYFKDKSSPGAAIYIVPSLKKMQFPIRLEYIHEGESKIYLDSIEAKDIYAITFTPTYNLLSDVYIRAEVSYVYANNGFNDIYGNPSNMKYNFAIETGIKL